MEKNEKDGYNPLGMIVSCFIAKMYSWLQFRPEVLDVFFVSLTVRRGIRLASRPWVRLVPG